LLYRFAAGNRAFEKLQDVFAIHAERTQVTAMADETIGRRTELGEIGEESLEEKLVERAPGIGRLGLFPEILENVRIAQGSQEKRRHETELFLDLCKDCALRGLGIHEGIKRLTRLGRNSRNSGNSY
jgi:hypothetical protein